VFDSFGAIVVRCHRIELVIDFNNALVHFKIF
jgi:hypothetical protein